MFMQKATPISILEEKIKWKALGIGLSHTATFQR